MKYYGSHSSDIEGLLLFLELCEQGCLSSLLEKKRLTEVEVLKIFKQLISGMAYINKLSIFLITQDTSIGTSNLITCLSPKIIA